MKKILLGTVALVAATIVSVMAANAQLSSVDPPSVHLAISSDIVVCTENNNTLIRTTAEADQAFLTSVASNQPVIAIAIRNGADDFVDEPYLPVLDESAVTPATTVDTAVNSGYDVIKPERTPLPGIVAKETQMMLVNGSQASTETMILVNASQAPQASSFEIKSVVMKTTTPGGHNRGSPSQMDLSDNLNTVKVG